MDSTTVLTVLHALDLDVYAPVILAVIGLASALAAILPVPQAGSNWGAARAALDLIACNIGQARNASHTPGAPATPATPNSSPNSTKTGAKLGAIMLLAGTIAACTSTERASVTTAITDGQLYCATATASGPLIVALAEAAGAPISVIGKTAATVSQLCGVISAIPVVPPADKAATPVVAVVPPPA